MSESHLIYPTLDLFLYDLCAGLGQEDAVIQQNRNHFWRRLYPTLNDTQLAAKLTEVALAPSIDSPFRPLLNDKIQRWSPEADGYYYPVQLGDTYALHVDYSGNHGNDSSGPPLAHPVHNLRTFKTEIEHRIQQRPGTIGQTWTVWGQLPETHPDPEPVAKACYERLAPDVSYTWKDDLQGQGQLLGASVFELWHGPSSAISPHKHFHLLICLLPPSLSIEATNQQLGSLYIDFLRLYHYRHKILWAYQQSQQLKVDLSAQQVVIQQKIQAVTAQATTTQTQQPHRQKLRTILTDSLTLTSQYAPLLSQLQNQGHTVRVNWDNYNHRLEKISKDYPDCNIDFLTDFTTTFAPKYAAQIEVDYASFSPGLTLLDNLINTVRGIIDIEQAGHDRRLNETIAVTGIGLAVSSLAVSVLSAQLPPPKNQPFFFTPAFYLSLLTAVLASFITWCLIRCFVHPR